jgi:putative transposase
MRTAYPSDLTDEQWALIEPLTPVHEVGRPRTNEMREALNAIFLEPLQTGFVRARSTAERLDSFGAESFGP